MSHMEKSQRGQQSRRFQAHLFHGHIRAATIYTQQLSANNLKINRIAFTQLKIERVTSRGAGGEPNSWRENPQVGGIS